MTNLGTGLLGDGTLGAPGSAAQTIGPASVASGEAVAAPTLDIVGGALSPFTIDSVESLGAPILAFSGVLVLDTIASVEDVGAFALFPETTTVVPASIASAEVVGPISLPGTGQALGPDSVVSAEAVGLPLFVLYRDLGVLTAALSFTETVTLTTVSDLGPLLARLDFGARLVLGIDPVLATMPPEYVPGRRVSIVMPVPVLDDRGRPT